MCLKKMSDTKRHFRGRGTGGTQERQADCCTEEEDVHHESSSDDATSVARRRPLCSFQSFPQTLGQDFGGRQDDHGEKDFEESQRGSGQDAPD
jgi:hypothetical protein